VFREAAQQLRLKNGAMGPVAFTVGGFVASPLLETYNGGTTYSGIVTVTAPNATDALHTIAVLAQGGGAVPSSVPAVASGAPAPSTGSLAQLTVTPGINFGGSIAPVMAAPSFGGLSPRYAGLHHPRTSPC
jgi:hypothetical protein